MCVVVHGIESFGRVHGNNVVVIPFRQVVSAITPFEVWRIQFVHENADCMQRIISYTDCQKAAKRGFNSCV